VLEFRIVGVTGSKVEGSVLAVASVARTVVLGGLELEFVLRPTVSRTVGLGIRPPFGTLDQILSCSSFV
jgi:hypothetical protein